MALKIKLFVPPSFSLLRSYTGPSLNICDLIFSIRHELVSRNLKMVLFSVFGAISEFYKMFVSKTL